GADGGTEGAPPAGAAADGGVTAPSGSAADGGDGAPPPGASAPAGATPVSGGCTAAGAGGTASAIAGLVALVGVVLGRRRRRR
ncbi:MAG TPA: MYXO-CTERM sorting domain-containing protein, partial [Polyangia bacterium]